MKRTFSDYAAKLYPLAISELQAALKAEPDFNVFHCMVLKFLYIIENKEIELSNEKDQDHVKQVITKMCHELLAFVWCLNGGSHHGCFHHLRSMIEITAVANYLHAEGHQEKRSKRVKKYYEYQNLAKFKHYENLKRKLERRDITQEQFDSDCVVRPIDIQSFTKDQIESWVALWEPRNSDPMKIHNWHYPATIDNLVEKAEPEFQSLYGHISHMVHVSPMSKNLVGQNIILQKNQIPRVMEYVILASSICHKFFRVLDDWLEIDTSTHMVPVFEQFSHLKHVAKSLKKQ